MEYKLTHCLFKNTFIGSTAGDSDEVDEPEMDLDEDESASRIQELPDGLASSYAGSDFLDVKARSMAEGDKSTDDEATTTHSDTHESQANGPGNAKTMARRTHHKSKRSKEQLKRDKLWKRCGLLLFWGFAATVLITVGEKHLLEKILEVPQGEQGKCE